MVFARDLPQSFDEALRVCKEILSGNHDLVRKGVIDTEAEQIVIAAHRRATGERLSRAELFSRLRDRLPDTSAERVIVFAGARQHGKLLQHILGFQVFLDHEYEVNPSTLIPRPETEALVDQSLKRLKQPKLGIEIGIGSGVISIELLHAFPGLRMIATEVSQTAVELARRNAAAVLGSANRLDLRIVKDARAVLEPLAEVRADFLISNPPYLIPSETESEVLKNEPNSALFPEGGDPLHFYRAIASGADRLLKPEGKVFLEIAAERAGETETLFSRRWKTEVLPDLTGKPRILIAEKMS